MIILTLHKDALEPFDFLKGNPTKVYTNGDYFSLLYHEPPNNALVSFYLETVKVSIVDNPKLNPSWKLIRDLPIATANKDLMEVLEDLERYKLLEQRRGTGLELNGWILDTISNGIKTPTDTAYFVKLMFLAGYDLEQVIGLFSAISKRTELARYFIELSQRLYKGAAIEHH